MERSKFSFGLSLKASLLWFKDHIGRLQQLRDARKLVRLCLHNHRLKRLPNLPIEELLARHCDRHVLLFSIYQLGLRELNSCAMLATLVHAKLLA